MNDSAVLRRGDWARGRREWASVNRKRGNHLELANWVKGRIDVDQVRLQSEAQSHQAVAEMKKAIAAYQLEAERTVRITIQTEDVTPAPLPEKTEAAAKVTVSAIRMLRLYTGAALMGAIVGGLAFSWLGHREVAQMTGALCAVLGYFIVRSGNMHGKHAS